MLTMCGVDAFGGRAFTGGLRPQSGQSWSGRRRRSSCLLHLDCKDTQVRTFPVFKHRRRAFVFQRTWARGLPTQKSIQAAAVLAD